MAHLRATKTEKERKQSLPANIRFLSSAEVGARQSSGGSGTLFTPTPTKTSPKLSPSEETTELKAERQLVESPDFVRQREKRAQPLIQQGLSEKTAREQAGQALRAERVSGLAEDIKGREQFITEKEELPKLAELAVERRVFDPIEQLTISTEAEEDLRVMVRIAKSLIPESLSKVYKAIDTIGGLADFNKKTFISPSEITSINEDMKAAIEAESSAQIDARIDDTNQLLIETGISIPILPLVVGAVAVSTISKPISEFTGTDGQIKSLELALSQYNEMITIPARSLAVGLDPMIAFDKYDEMELGIIALEQQLKQSGRTSIKVALALRGRGIEARVLKLKEKLQEGRRIIFNRMAQEVFGEVDVPKGMTWVRNLQRDLKSKREEKERLENERKKNK